MISIGQVNNPDSEPGPRGAGPGRIWSARTTGPWRRPQQERPYSYNVEGRRLQLHGDVAAAATFVAKPHEALREPPMSSSSPPASRLLQGPSRLRRV